MKGNIENINFISVTGQIGFVYEILQTRPSIITYSINWTGRWALPRYITFTYDFKTPTFVLAGKRKADTNEASTVVLNNRPDHNLIVWAGAFPGSGYFFKMTRLYPGQDIEEKL